jgi:hypothetical protein
MISEDYNNDKKLEPDPVHLKVVTELSVMSFDNELYWYTDALVLDEDQEAYGLPALTGMGLLGLLITIGEIPC